MLISGVDVQCSTTYRIDYEWECSFEKGLENEEKISKYWLAVLAKYPNVTNTAWKAGPCWNAYVLITSESKSDALKVVEDFIRYLRRFKGIKFL